MNLAEPGNERNMQQQDVLPAKLPATALAGPYGHPFHPLLVTVPIGAWVASLAFDVVAHLVSDGQSFATGARWLIGIGVLGTLVAAVFGLMDLMIIPNGSRAFIVGIAHLCNNVAVVVLFSISFFLRVGDPVADGGLIVISVVGLIALSVSGWLGGRLAYRYGVRVATEAVQAEGLTSPVGSRERSGRGRAPTSRSGWDRAAPSRRAGSSTTDATSSLPPS
jgi:uncharacterized membrane protein